MKTIFFSIASQLGLRNLFFVKNGVFDLLRSQKDIKVVLVMNGKLYSKYESYFQTIISDNVTIEIVNCGYNIIAKNWLQRIFVFFYSYLIFTPTTDLLSSWGARADNVSIANTIMYPFKWLNYHLFGHFNFIKEKLVPKMFFWIFPERRYKEIFDKHSPDLVFLPNVAHNPDLEILAEAKRRNIKTVGMCGSWDHFNKYFVPLRSDILLAWNDPLKEEAIIFEKYKPEQIKMVGFPQFDEYVNSENKVTKEEFLKKIGFSGAGKIIFFASEGLYSLDGPDIMDMMIEWIDAGKIPQNTRIILRLYPGSGDEETYKRFFGHPYVYTNGTSSSDTREGFLSFINLLYHSDVIINTYSTISVEALVFDKPIININFDGRHQRTRYNTVKRLSKLSHFKHVSASGAISNVSSEEELATTLFSYIKVPTIKGDERGVARARMCYLLDGKSSERIVNNILEYLNK